MVRRRPAQARAGRPPVLPARELDQRSAPECRCPGQATGLMKRRGPRHSQSWPCEFVRDAGSCITNPPPPILAQRFRRGEPAHRRIGFALTVANYLRCNAYFAWHRDHCRSGFRPAWPAVRRTVDQGTAPVELGKPRRPRCAKGRLRALTGVIRDQPDDLQRRAGSRGRARPRRDRDCRRRARPQPGAHRAWQGS